MSIKKVSLEIIQMENGYLVLEKKILKDEVFDQQFIDTKRWVARDRDDLKCLILDLTKPPIDPFNK